MTKASKEYKFDKNGNVLVEKDRISDEITERSYDEDGNIVEEKMESVYYWLKKSTTIQME